MTPTLDDKRAALQRALSDVTTGSVTAVGARSYLDSEGDEDFLMVVLRLAAPRGQGWDVDDWRALSRLSRHKAWELGIEVPVRVVFEGGGDAGDDEAGDTLADVLAHHPLS